MTCCNCNTCPFEIQSVDQKVYYEIHITVTYDKRFVEFCNLNNIWVIDIDLGENIPSQLMTSIAKQFDSDKDLYDYVEELKSLIQANGFHIERVKVETSPNHPLAGSNNYFECHLGILNPDKALRELSNGLGLHMSKNKLKSGIQMLTYRSYHDKGVDGFKERVQTRKAILESNGYQVEKVIIEWCLYDDNLNLDSQWMKSSQN